MQKNASTLSDADLMVGYYLYHTGDECNPNLINAALAAIDKATNNGLTSLFNKAFKDEAGIFDWARKKREEREEQLVEQVGRDGFMQIVRSSHVVNAFEEVKSASIPTKSDNDEIFAYDSLLKLCETAEPYRFEYITNEVVKLFNSTHSVVIHGSKTLVAEEVVDHKGNACYTFSAVQQKKQLYSNLNLPYNSVNGDKTTLKKMNVFNHWMRDIRRKTYQGVVFDPSDRAGERFLNIWSGFAVKAASGEDRLDRIKWHLLHIICDGNTDNFEYLLAWMAHIIQKPEQKSGVCLVLKSEARGTGKSTVSVIMEKLLGQHAMRVQDEKHVLGTFNSHLANKLFVTIEEAFWSGSNKDAGKLRTLITESSITIEGKGKDAIEVESYHRFMMCTNNSWAVPQSADERRFFILEVSEQKKQNPDYFGRLYSDINSDEAMSQLLNFLQNYDLENYNLHKAPRTKATDLQAIESLPPEAKWMQSVLDEGSLEANGLYYDFSSSNKVPKEAFYRSYICYCDMVKAQGYSRLSKITLGSYIKKAAGIITSGGKMSVENRRVNAYLLPELATMKAQFCQYCNVPIEVMFD